MGFCAFAVKLEFDLVSHSRFYFFFSKKKKKAPIYELSGWISLIKLGEGLGASLETINIYKKKPFALM
jgi:hypothetical protein